MQYPSSLRPHLLAGVAAAAFASPVSAQPAANAPSQPIELASADAAIAADGATGSDQLAEIVVTATKRETNLQKTPIAISVVSPTAIEDRHIQSLIDVADGAVPSLRVATFEARQSALAVGIRGIVPFDANQTARDQGVGVYIDGVYLGRQQGLNAALFDVERIEVLRGPQGTLFGRNTEGGAVSIVTKAPSGEWGGSVITGVGNYGSYNGEAHINLPAFANLAIKLDGLIQHQDATTKNPLDGAVGWNAYNRVGGRISARWQPFEGFTADLSFDKARDENTPFYSQLVNFNPQGRPVISIAEQNARLAAGLTALPPGAISALPPLVGVHPDREKEADVGVPQQYSVDKTEGETINLRYLVSPAIELRSITAWRKVTTNQWDNSGGPERVPFVPNGKFSRYSLSDLDQSQFSQELQAVGSLPQLDYAVGLYYFNEHVRESAATPSSNQWNADGTDYVILSPVVIGPVTSGNQGWDRGSRFLQRASRAEAKSYSAFGQFTYTPDFAEALHLTVGGRYTKDKRDGVLYTVSGVATNYLFTYDRDRFDPLITLAFDVSPEANLYAKYATGFRAGGANDRSSTFLAFGPESVKSYELGAKLDLFDRRMRFNVAGYLMDRSGTQTDFDNVDTNQFLPGTTTPNPTFNLHTENTANAPGVSRIRGVEADLTAQPLENLTVGLSYAYTYTKVPATPNPNLPGNPLYQVYVVYTPPSAAAAFIDYDIPVGDSDAKVRLHLDANYADALYSFQNESVKTDSSFIVNGRLALADVTLAGATTATFSLWSRNLLNESHIYRRSAANAAVLGDYANFNPPRTFGGEVRIRF